MMISAAFGPAAAASPSEPDAVMLTTAFTLVAPTAM